MPTEQFSLGRYLERTRRADPLPVTGEVVRTVGLLVESRGPRAASASSASWWLPSDRRGLPLEVVGFRDGLLQTVPLGTTAGIRPGDRHRGAGRIGVRARGRGAARRASSTASASRSTRAGTIETYADYPLQPPPLNPLARDPIVAPLGTGVRAIDALLTCGRGQRIGLFGGSGVGRARCSA